MQRAILVLLCVLAACAGQSDSVHEAEGGAVRPDWAIVIHGGAGSPSRSMDEDRQRAYLQSLEAALRVGQELLSGGASSLDAVEAVIGRLEDDPRFNAGKGAVFNRAGVNELDASIMDGATLACGAVAGVRTIKNPISLARLVMERTRHVLLAGEGAEQFAKEAGVESVSPDYFFTQSRWESLQRVVTAEREKEKEKGGGTVGAVALDRAGNLAAGTSTGGLTAKMFGRVGDTPVIGAGTYADNRSCAVSCTGRGEEFIRRAVAYQVAARVEHSGVGVREAAEQIVHEQLQPGDGGLIALGADGEIAMVFNTQGMYRGAADSSGRFEVHIWE
jgi:beta-aspartyl-peptidase (threonine type)